MWQDGGSHYTAVTGVLYVAGWWITLRSCNWCIICGRMVDHITQL